MNMKLPQQFVTRMVVDQWAGAFCEEIEVLDPTGLEVSHAISSLNAKDKTVVTLFGHLGAYLSIGGGCGQYVVYASTANEELWNLLADDFESDASILLNVGGQEGDFPAEQIVPTQLAQQAAIFFMATGQLDMSLRWARQI